MEYLNQILGIHTVYLKSEIRSIPNYISERYRITPVSLDELPAVFVDLKREPETIDVLAKHMEKIRKIAGVPAVLIPAALTSREKSYLLREHIPFIVEKKQIYLPFMGMYLQQRSDGEKQNTEKMLPSAQLLLLYYIYSGCGELLTSEAAQKLGFTATSISRASRQLEEMGIVRTEKRGVQKVILSDMKPEELFYASRSLMNNPVKRKIYIPAKNLNNQLLLGGLSALAEYSAINPSSVMYYAADSISLYEKDSSNRLYSQKDQCCVELWRYDPEKLSEGKCVDRLSLALTLEEDRDERVEQAVEEMLSQVWRDISDQRNRVLQRMVQRL